VGNLPGVTDQYELVTEYISPFFNFFLGDILKIENFKGGKSCLSLA